MWFSEIRSGSNCLQQYCEECTPVCQQNYSMFLCGTSFVHISFSFKCKRLQFSAGFSHRNRSVECMCAWRHLCVLRKCRFYFGNFVFVVVANKFEFGCNKIFARRKTIKQLKTGKWMNEHIELKFRWEWHNLNGKRAWQNFRNATDSSPRNVEDSPSHYHPRFTTMWTAGAVLSNEPTK